MKASYIMSALDKNKADRHAIVVFVFSLSSSLFFVVTNCKKSQSFFSPLKLIIFDHEKPIRSWSKRYTMAKGTTSYWLARLKQWHLRPENSRGRPLKEDTLFFLRKIMGVRGTKVASKAGFATFWYWKFVKHVFFLCTCVSNVFCVHTCFCISNGKKNLASRQHTWYYTLQMNAIVKYARVL